MKEFICIKNGIKKEGESCTLNNNCIYPDCKQESWNSIYKNYHKQEGNVAHAVNFLEYLEKNYSPPVKLK